MSSQMYSMLLEDMGKTLKIQIKDLESDIKDMAEYWETTLEKTHISDRDTAISLLTSLVHCYLRGRGIRIASYQMLRKNKETLIALVTLVFLFSWKQPYKYYPTVRTILPRDIDNTVETITVVDVLSQAEEILKRKWED